MTLQISGSGNPVNVNGTNHGFYPTLMTPQNAIGTSVDFTGIPSWVKRITVIFNGVSTSGASGVYIQIGTSSGYLTSGYVGGSTFTSVGSSPLGYAGGGYRIYFGSSESAAISRDGLSTITLISDNTWIMSGLLSLRGGRSIQAPLRR